MAPEICCVVSGSFTKAKAEIDRTRVCFEDHGIKVVSPDLGGLFYPQPGLRWSKGAYPLLSERSISEDLARRRHLKAITKAHFLYVCAPEGFVGIHVALELGMAIGNDKPIYSDQLINQKLFADSPGGVGMIEVIQVKSPEEVARIWQNKY